MTVWIAAFAVLLAALAPSISHAIAAAKGTPGAWTEICTGTGLKRVQLDGKDASPHAPGKGDKSFHFDDCPFCLGHAVSLGLPPAVPPTLQSAAGPHFLPPLFYLAPRPLFAWIAAQPRAPPASS